MSYAWDFLRPITEFASHIDPLIKGIVTLLAFGFFLVAFAAYKKNPSQRLMLVTAAFFLFAIKWAIKTIDLFFSPGSFLADSSENVFELLILGLLFSAIIKK